MYINDRLLTLYHVTYHGRKDDSSLLRPLYGHYGVAASESQKSPHPVIKAGKYCPGWAGWLGLTRPFSAAQGRQTPLPLHIRRR